MAACANARSGLHALPSLPTQATGTNAVKTELSLIDALVAELADRVADAVALRLSASDQCPGEWLDSRHAADYLGMHRDTLRKLAAERTIPSQQDAPGCKLYFKRADLDTWRRTGGRPSRLAKVVGRAA